MQKPDTTRYLGWRRHALGIIAALLLISALILMLTSKTAQVMSLVFRVGLVLGALWLAWPQLVAIFRRFPPWMIGASLLGIALVVVQPRMVFYLIPIAGVLLAFKFFRWLVTPNSVERK